MRISEKTLLSLIVCVVTVVASGRALGAVIGVVQEGQSLTINGFTVTNNNAFPVTLSGLAASVLNPNFAGDPSDFVTGVTLAGGTCIPLLGVVNGLAANNACTVNLAFSTPAADAGEPIDSGTSQITFNGIFNGSPVGTLLFEIQVNDAPVPEPDPAMLTGLGTVALIGARWVVQKRRLIRGRSST